MSDNWKYTTKAEMAETIAALQYKLEHPPLPSAVPEADALATCIRAFESMRSRETNSRSNSYASSFAGDFGRRSQSSTERVLRSLAARYDIDLIEHRIEPCSRPHVDPMRLQNLQQEINGLSVQS